MVTPLKKDVGPRIHTPSFHSTPLFVSHSLILQVQVVYCAGNNASLAAAAAAATTAAAITTAAAASAVFLAIFAVLVVVDYELVAELRLFHRPGRANPHQILTRAAERNFYPAKG